MKILKTIFYILFFIVTVIAISGCGKKAALKEKDEAVPVKAMKVALKDMDRYLEYVGDIKGQDEAIVYPKVSGKIIEKIKEDGSAVEKGDVIAYIDRDEVGLKFEKAPVESPLAGTVGRVYVDIGSSVTPQTPIAIICNMGKAEIDLNIPEKYLSNVALGQEAEIVVDAYPDEKFIGKVDQISPIVDLATRAAPVEIVIDNSACHLQSGMFAKVKLAIEERKNAPVVLREAVMGKEPNTYVYVINGDKAVLTKVTPGIRQGPYVELTDGVKEDDLVVILGQQRLKDGSLVNVEVESE
ncbi:MAG: efflux RND transporter periplasmic adaptor subunit [Candidatus Omnitrophota bacterium]|nr:efflux RND transporter periplasmic adaptor subunit [Candidatus Omnitrophota bacterium]